jgi:site-specific DNA recombinase
MGRFRDYIDPGLSGTDDNRPEFQRMIKDALSGLFKVIVVHSFDRFSRNLEHIVLYKGLLRREGVQTVSVIEPLDTGSPFAFIHEGIIDLFAAFYSINLSAKIRAGQKKAIEQGRWPRKPPKGYKMVGGGVVEVAENGAQITWAFDEFATGKYTLETWAERAYQSGIRNSKGDRLQPSHWSYIFNNPFYTGILVWNDQQATGQHQSLVDRETYDRVQAILRAHEGWVEHKVYRSFLLRGLCYSLDANSIMTGATGKGYEYYRSRAQTPAGTRHHVPAKLLEAQLVTILQRVTIVPHDLNRITVDESMLLALRVAPHLGAIYQWLKDDEQRLALLKMVVARYGLKVSGQTIVDVDLLPPFCFALDITTVGHTRVEPYPYFLFIPQGVAP